MKTARPGFAKRRQEEALQQRLSPESGEAANEAGIDHRHDKAVYWLGSLAVVVSLLLGILYLMESETPRTADSDQPGLASEDTQSQSDITLGRAFQVLSSRH
jgi:hypothetical protein